MQLLKICGIAVLILIGTFCIGLIPIYLVNGRLRSSERLFRATSLFGVGMILGTSFMLVIPEGISECKDESAYGISMMAGFLFVYIVDQTVRWAESRNPSTLNDSNHISCWYDLLLLNKTAMSVVHNNVVLALVIHGFSDGMVIGLSANHETLNMLIIVTILIHKIPAVLSLVTLMLVKQGLNKYEACSNLLAFSLSTPVGYIIFSMISILSDRMDDFGGNLLLISGGSLFYASCHSLLDNAHILPVGSQSGVSIASNGAPETFDVDVQSLEEDPWHEEAQNSKVPDALYTLFGALIPTAFSRWK
ncbi:HEL237Wp [Eremothecium sinecaudum]|uniref:HEL237Wp n=1 Tax=Eremothecium sinecaudum TaxID=45286 RepID=A0A0X8HT77_9SACH|nr:HEL237Wp [Eremothecium sinecaudum]AMD21044.1 HEL237Wp [Eremothecium sinecaudum]